MPEVLVVAGEPSGEEHALSFLPQLQALRPELTFFGVGGPGLKARGQEQLYTLGQFSSMGFSEVIGKIPFYKTALEHLEAEVRRRRCRDAILVDFQDFNLRLAQRLAKSGVRVWYYVAPQAWAWRPWRAKTLARSVHRLYTILPFEEEWFRSRGVAQVTPVPHPLVHNWAAGIRRLTARPWRAELRHSPRLVLLPGSRASEVRALLPEFVRTCRLLRREFPGLHVSLARVSHLSDELYDCARPVVDQWLSDEELATHLLTRDAALAASGTVTLGTGLLALPTVVAYRSSLLNEFVVRSLIGYNRPVSLTNLIAEQEVFPEFLQQQAQAPLMARALGRFWREPREWLRTQQILAGLLSRVTSGERAVYERMAQEMGK